MPNVDTRELRSTLAIDDSMITSCSPRSSEHDLDSDVDSANMENLLLEDLDLYMDDINSRLIVSRMVGNSVIRGIVNAIAEDSAETISSKEAQIEELNRRLQLYEPIAGLRGASPSQVQFTRLGLREDDDGMMGSLNIAAEKHLEVLKREIEWMRSSDFLKGTQLGQGRSLESLTQMDKNIDALREIMGIIFKNSSEMSSLLKESLNEQQWQREIQREVDSAIVQNIIREMREGFETKLCEQTSLFDAQNDYWLKKVGEISDLHQELKFVSKSMLSIEPEHHHHLPHGSQESYEEWDNSKKKDHVSGKLYGYSAVTDSSRVGENGVVSEEKSGNTAPEIAESSLLLHLSKEELISHYKTEISEMKRQLESSIQEKTEELFRWKRQFLKERGFSHTKKEKELEALKKRLPDISLRLDGVLLEAKNFYAVQDDHDKTFSFKQRIDGLLLENKSLRDLLASKSKEVDRLASQVSEAAKRMTKYSSLEKTLLKKKRKLEWEIEDAETETFIRSQIDTCILSELIHDSECRGEDAHTETEIMENIYGVILGGLIVDARSLVNSIRVCAEKNNILAAVVSQKDKALDLEVEKAERLRQEVASLSTLVNERDIALSSEVKKSETLSQKLEKAEQLKKEVLLLSTLVREKDITLSLEVKRSEELSQELVSLRGFIEEKNMLIVDLESKLRKQEQDLDQDSEELSKLKAQVDEQERSLWGYRAESDLVKSRLDEAMKKIGQSDAEIFNLNQKLALASNNMREAEKEKIMLYNIIQEKENRLSSATARVDERTQQMESIVVFVKELSRSVVELERIILRKLERRSSRLEELFSECDELSKLASLFKRRELQYKKELEIRYRDLRKEIEIIVCNHERAENEVDRLGDEVDDLISVLEKVCIALDHYSPVLQHYTGVVEVLEMVKRKLKDVCRETRPTADE
ncbi:unnamed protein product [Spirodela intermedia]|uniref:Uncharacterized protein n=1 Tax=Spirodela intermedia TaxID=51605 RepID=A0A7I8L4J1_SPIIN|nr:unnamed protein product [Spirodela intermedia]